jgi:Leucine-rich repeat (LRR) protein
VIGFKNLSSIDSGIFQHLPHLEKLCLANNAIERTESGSLDHLNTPEKSLNTFCFDKPHPGVQCRLKELNFTGNQFGCILKRSISHLPTSLSKLNLCNNKIVDIESGAFENMVNLRFLNLAWNLYETLDLNNILHRDTAYILYLHIESNMKSLMMWNDLSEQKEDGVSSIAMKREQRGISSFPMRKFFQHPVFVTVSEIQHEANRVVFNKMVDDGLIFISAACYYIP